MLDFFKSNNRKQFANKILESLIKFDKNEVKNSTEKLCNTFTPEDILNEADFRCIFQSCFALEDVFTMYNESQFKLESDVTKVGGGKKVDLILIREKTVNIIEFKYNDTSKVALNQITYRQYVERTIGLLERKKIIKTSDIALMRVIGLNLSRVKKSFVADIGSFDLDQKSLTNLIK